MINPWLSGLRSFRLVTGECHAPAPPSDFAHNESVKLSSGFKPATQSCWMMLDEPLNVAEVPVLAVAPSDPNSTSVTVLAVNSPLVELPSSSSGKWATRPSVSCAFTLAMPTNMNALNTPAAIKRRAVISFLIMVWLLFGVIVCRLLIIKLLVPIRFRFKLVLLLKASLAFNTDNRQLRDQ